MSANDGDYDPHADRGHIKKPISDLYAFFYMVKATIGEGVLSLPISFFRAGLVIACLLGPATALLNVYGTCLLVKTQYKIAKRNKKPYAPYGWAVSWSLKEGPRCMRKLACVGEYVVDFCLIGYHLGVITVFLIYLSKTYYEMLDRPHPQWVCQLIITAIITPMVNIRSWNASAIIAALGALFLLYSFIVLFYFIFRPDKAGFAGVDNPRLFGGIKEWPFVMGTMLYGIQCFGIVISLDEKMKKPQHLIGKGGLPGLYPLTMIGILILYAVIGVCGVLKYGNDLKQVIPLNLPNTKLGYSVKLGFVCAIFCTFPVYMFPILNVIYRQWAMKYIQDNPMYFRCHWVEHCLRMLILITANFLGSIVPDVDKFATLVGSVTNSLLTIFLPALLDFLWRRRNMVEDGKSCHISMVIDIFMMIFGVFVFFITSTSAIMAESH